MGQYQLLNRLGTGGMGRVYLGQAPGGQMVAVKLIRAELADDPDFRRRFAYEVAAAKRVSGVFTAPVVDADPDGPQPWLVTAYVSGPSLAAAVAEIGPLPVESVRTLAAGLAAGLSAVHAAGIVHRDLKPSNVLLASDGPRIIDFGISRAADTAWLTRAGGVMGSPGFMSPEQAEGHKVGPPTDIFSLGGVLAFAASGRSPFGAGSPSALLYRVVYGTAALGHVPAELRPLIERCLAKDPSARPTTRQLLAELGAAEPNKDWLSRHAPFLRGPASVAARATSVARGSHGASAGGRAAGGTAAARAVAVPLTVVDGAPAAAPASLTDRARPAQLTDRARPQLTDQAAPALLEDHAAPAPRSAPDRLAGLQPDSRAAHQAPASAAPQGAPPAAPQHPAVSTPPGGAPAASQSGGQPAPDYAAASAAALAAPAGAVAGTGFRDYDTAA
ncbi:MAG TPA: serine/threonine-protein kinase, partial [Streptosporangiaceae bacterium]|nr:serine/threonine-protein kinase [Streptosporangiaceae bacterium]